MVELTEIDQSNSSSSDKNLKASFEKTDENDNNKEIAINKKIEEEKSDLEISSTNEVVNISSEGETVIDTINESNDGCRYCFRNMKPEENVSSCQCYGMLCRKCLARELMLTRNRGNGKMCCTVCKQLFDVNEISKHSSISKIFNFIYFVIFFSFPFTSACCSGKPWFSWVKRFPDFRQLITLFILSIWMGFTIIMDYWLGIYINSLVRAVVFFFDMVAIVQMYNLSQSCISKKWKNFITIYLILIHSARIAVLSYYMYSMLETYSDDLQNPDSTNTNLLKVNEAIFSLQWMIFTSAGNIIVTSIFFWVDMVNDFVTEFNKAKTVTVGGHGPFLIIEELSDVDAEDY